MMGWLFGKNNTKTSFDIACYQNQGKRTAQEDSIGICQRDEKYGFILCDGLGGHGMGDTASLTAVEAFRTQFYHADSMASFLSNAFISAQDSVMQKQKELNAREKMKTTAVMMATDQEKAYVGHIGDSRIYLFHNGRILCRTLDHSIPQMLVLSREIKESEIRHHPDRNIVLRVIGVEWENPMYELMNPIALRKIDAALLCSDGFWENIEEKEMIKFLREADDAESWLRKMKETVLMNGENVELDNNSAIAIIAKREKS